MAGSDDGDDREWAISLEDLEADDDEGSSTGDASDDGDAADGEGGDLATTRPVDPGSPSLENVAFFLLGIVTAAAVVYALVP